MKVCVVGGGTAGAEAAREAEMNGADVTVIEKSERPDPPWKTWPDHLIPSRSGEDSPGPPPKTRGPFTTTLVKEATAVGPESIMTKDGLRIPFDSVIVATGCGFEPVYFPGSRKPGVLILDGVSQYEELGRILGEANRCVVQGEGVRALEVADRLSGSGRSVRVLISGWQQAEPSAPIPAVIEHAAREMGVSIARGSLSKAVGSGSLEAVVTGGEVISCDVLALVPRRVPRVVPIQASLGRCGGLLVDKRLRTTSRSTYAAGGCAELGSGLPASASLEGEAATSGRIAGANSTGENLSVGPVRLREATIFGLRWTRVGIGLTPARAHGLSVRAVSHTWETTSACTIVYERLSGRVVGIESVERETASPPGLPLLSSAPVSLRTLAYGSPNGSSDISLVSDTARLGLRLWSKS